jgi:transcription-repair coupling factor (superfamily II helicase)
MMRLSLPQVDGSLKADTENSDRNSMVNKHVLQQQEEPMLDSDDEIDTSNFLQPEMQCSLKSAEKISLFPLNKNLIHERANHTINANFSSSFDLRESNNQKTLRQIAIENAEQALNIEMNQHQYNSTCSYASDNLNQTSVTYQRSFYGEEIND